jgi:hypothetical protein
MGEIADVHEWLDRLAGLKPDERQKISELSREDRTPSELMDHPKHKLQPEWNRRPGWRRAHMPPHGHTPQTAAGFAPRWCAFSSGKQWLRPQGSPFLSGLFESG